MSGLHFGVRFWTPKRGPFCRQNFKVTGRKIARGSIVSAGTRQKFSMPLLFHGTGTCSPRPANIYGHNVLELFKNRCGHKRSQGVENNCSRRCKTMEPSGPAVCKTSVAGKQSALFSPDGKNFADKRPPFWGPFFVGKILRSPGEK